MWKKIIDYYKIPEAAKEPSTDSARFKKIRLISFLTATLGYGMYYVCRLSMNVIRKPMVDDGVFTETEIGIIGSCLFFTYAIGKFCNGFIADRSNVKKLMSTGLLISALINLALGFTNSFIVFAVLWGINGYFQSMGAASGVVSLSRWFDASNRGTYYGYWRASSDVATSTSQARRTIWLPTVSSTHTTVVVALTHSCSSSYTSHTVATSKSLLHAVSTLRLTSRASGTTSTA